MQIYAQYVHRWILQTWGYLFARDSMGLSSFASRQKAPENVIQYKLVHYSESRSSIGSRYNDL